MPRKTKQLDIDNKNFINTDGTKTRIELLPSGRIVPYKKELWKKSTITLFKKVTEKKFGKMQTKKKAPKKQNKTVKKVTIKKKVKKTVKKRITVKKKPAKKNKTKKIKCPQKKRIECMEKDKICNPETGRCKKPVLHKTMKKVMKDLKTISRMRSYSPSINKDIERLSISPHRNLIGPCKDNQVFVPKKGSKPYNLLTGQSDSDGYVDGKCTSWKAKSSQKHLLDNLKSKKSIVAKNIRGPFQNRSNCWFNTFFMMFFISDKGRKFMKAFRESMITGKFKTTGKKIPDSIRYPFWLLNKMITGVLIGSKDPEEYWSYMDTNKVINEIYKKLKKYSNKHILGYKEIIKPGDPGNPIVMYQTIVNYFDNRYNSKGFGLTSLDIRNYNHFNDLSKKDSKWYNWVLENEPHIIIIQMTDSLDGDKGPTKWMGKIGNTNKYAQVKDFKKKKKYTFTGHSNKVEYTLDSMGIRDNNRHHICALVTLNKNDYMFDGENNITVMRNDWKNLLNTDKNFKITSRISETYNLTKGYQCLVYYRSK